MRELKDTEIEGVSGGTSIYDYRSGDPGSGLPNDPLNTGNTAIDYANAVALLANGEMSPAQLSVYSPVLATAIATDIASGIFSGSAVEENVLNHCEDLAQASTTLTTFGTTVASAGGAWILYSGPPDPTDGGAAAVTAFGLIAATIGGAGHLAHMAFCEG